MGIFLTKFNAIKRKLDEEVVEFIKIFNKLYNTLPLEIKPPPASAKVVFAREFESNFGFTFKGKMISHLRSNSN